MKSLHDVNAAREILKQRILREGRSLDRAQLALLTGMLNALVWVADGPDCTTIQRVLEGEPMFPGREVRG